MTATDTAVRVEQTAQELFEVFTQLGLVLPRGRRRGGQLKEIEYLTLAILQDHGTLIVGDIQRHLGVLPAQMSRIIRALEDRARPMIVCQINPRDKRKIDVCVTPAGEKALQEYQAAWAARIADLLQDLPEDEQDDVARLVEKLRGVLAQRPTAPCRS